MCYHLYHSSLVADDYMGVSQQWYTAALDVTHPAIEWSTKGRYSHKSMARTELGRINIGPLTLALRKYPGASFH
jgi:hypothetical protein